MELSSESPSSPRVDREPQKSTGFSGPLKYRPSRTVADYPANDYTALERRGTETEEMKHVINEYLKRIETALERGYYKDSWESLGDYPVPSWFRKAKFGVFIHWGVYSVPAFGNEWYPRNMYIRGTPEFEHHIKVWGRHRDFGYKDFIPLFKAERFDAGAWLRLFKEAGARYVVPVAEHHDGFQMYDSAVSEWNSVRMGPKIDVLRELKKSADEEGIAFCASSHRAENYFFFAGGRDFDSGIRDIVYEEPYGYACRDFSTAASLKITNDIHGVPAPREHLEEWLVRSCELVDTYQPMMVYFDWWIQNISFKPYLRKFAAYYYNRARDWGKDVVIAYKHDAFMYSTAVFDVERGGLNGISPRPWQSDTAIAKNSWGYTTGNEYKGPEELVRELVDIVSKNGCLLLNVGPKPDGTITEEEQRVLRAIGSWLRINGEAIYDTSHWIRHGEGPTTLPAGAFAETSDTVFTSKDVRFTFKAPWLYAFVLRWPEDGAVCIESLRRLSGNAEIGFRGHIESVEVLGYPNPVRFRQDSEGLFVNVEGSIESSFPVCLKIRID
jgi:alpha-L-fucosidase